MGNTYQLESAKRTDVQTSEPLRDTQEHAVSGDAMLGWMTDEEFDLVADSIVGHFESLADDLQPQGEKENDTSIGEIVDWLLKEGVKLMPESALKYLHDLIEQQIKNNGTSNIIYAEHSEWTPSRRVVKSEVY